LVYLRLEAQSSGWCVCCTRVLEIVNCICVIIQSLNDIHILWPNSLKFPWNTTTTHTYSVYHYMVKLFIMDIVTFTMCSFTRRLTVGIVISIFCLSWISSPITHYKSILVKPVNRTITMWLRWQYLAVCLNIHTFRIVSHMKI